MGEKKSITKVSDKDCLLGAGGKKRPVFVFCKRFLILQRLHFLCLEVRNIGGEGGEEGSFYTHAVQFLYSSCVFCEIQEDLRICNLQKFEKPGNQSCDLFSFFFQDFLIHRKKLLFF